MEREYTDAFGAWWNTLNQSAQEDLSAVVALLEEKGPALPFPFSSSIESSKYSHMRELRIQNKANPLRVLYAFDRRRTAILLIGGNKKGNKRWYTTHVPLADRLYAEYLLEREKEDKK